MTTVCTACEGQGSHERLATPTEVDNGNEFGVAFDECEVCKGRGVVFEEPIVMEDVTKAKERWVAEHGPAPEGWTWAFLGRIDEMELVPIPGFRLPPDTLLGVPDFDAQAEMGQGPPA